jgi:hypothetical protein
MADYADDDDDEPAIGYMFDSHAPSEFQTFACPKRGGGTLRVDYACQRDQDCSTTADQSGHSVWPAAKQLAEYVSLHVDVKGKTVVELGCGARSAPHDRPPRAVRQVSASWASPASTSAPRA